MKISTILLFGKIQTELFANYYRMVSLKVNIFVFVESCAWAVSNTNEHSRAFAGTHDQLRVCCNGAMSAFECSQVITVPSHHAHESLWLLMIAYEHLRVIMTSHKCSLVLMSFLWVNRYIGLTILKAKKNLKKKNWKNVGFEKKPSPPYMLE